MPGRVDSGLRSRHLLLIFLPPRLLDSLLSKDSLIFSLKGLVDLGTLGWLVAMSLSSPGRWLLSGLLSLFLPLLLLGSLVELVGNGLLVSRVEVLVRVLDTLLVLWSRVLWLWAAVRPLVGGRAVGSGEFRSLVRIEFLCTLPCVLTGA